MPVLLIFSGLPASGKSTLAQEIAKQTQSVYLRIDTIEQGLRDLCGIDVQGEGYRLAYRVAADNLRMGLSVVADSCNPDELTRNEWDSVAQDAGTRHLNIEVVCSDAAEHRRRLESRSTEVAGLKLPTWSDVQNREYHNWQSQRIVIDTAGRSTRESADELLRSIKATLSDTNNSHSINYRVDQIDHVEITVADRFQAAAWYEDVLGLQIVEEFRFWASDPFGPLMISTQDGSTKVALFERDTLKSPQSIGIYLLAFRVEAPGFVTFVERLQNMDLRDKNNERVTPSNVVDHKKAFSVYFCDPYHNQLELTTYDYDAVAEWLNNRSTARA